MACLRFIKKHINIWELLSFIVSVLFALISVKKIRNFKQMKFWSADTKELLTDR